MPILGRDTAADEPGIAALRHDRQPYLGADPHHRRDLGGRSRADDEPGWWRRGRAVAPRRDRVPARRDRRSIPNAVAMRIGKPRGLKRGLNSPNRGLLQEWSSIRNGRTTTEYEKSNRTRHISPALPKQDKDKSNWRDPSYCESLPFMRWTSSPGDRSDPAPSDHPDRRRTVLSW